jgi:N6-L-threonylcarbamoyladenine synthase
MALVLGIETSCDETAAAVYDSDKKKLLSSAIFSQIKLHEIYGGVVPEIASRSHLEKIDLVLREAIKEAKISIDDLDSIAVTNKPGLVGSLLIGLCFAKGLAWAKNKKLIAVNHLEGHIFSSFLQKDFSINKEILGFPHLNLLVSGGHTAFYLVNGFVDYELIGQTFDDAAGEGEVEFKDFFNYPRSRSKEKDLNFSFSGLKTAVLYDLVKKGVFNLNKGIIKSKITPTLQKEVASSLLICVGDIFERSLKLAFKKYPNATGFSFVGGVACNKYLKDRLESVCKDHEKAFVSPPCTFCSDNAAMVAFVGSYKAEQGKLAGLDLDVLK